MSRQTGLILAIVIILIIAFALNRTFNHLYPKPSPTHQISTQPSPTSSPSFALGVQTKTDNCQISNYFPDKSCTPGAIIPTATKDQVCTPGYSKEVRNVPDSEKEQVFKEYGITSHSQGGYEVDHLISLELGGSNDISNLWPEAAEPRPGYHEKDKVENYLHSQVCNGQISLQDAQLQISQNWLYVYNQIPH